MGINKKELYTFSLHIVNIKNNHQTIWKNPPLNLSKWQRSHIRLHYMYRKPPNLKNDSKP